MTSAVESRNDILARTFGWVGFPLILIVVALVGLLPMTWQQQTTFGALMVAVAIIAGRVSGSRVATITLIVLSLCATTRYAIWRVDSLRHYFFAPWSHVNPLDAFFMLLLLAAELYSFLILYLGFMQTIAPLKRPPIPLPADVEQWPTVDIMIPTFNEPMDVVRYTVLAAKQQDWPKDRFKVWLLDDGDRPEFRAFAEEAGVGYIARPEHNHAKAGNINYALARTTGELVAIFDCDHVPTRSFLQVTTGWFLRDAKLGMLQTPHHFYSPDPFERNLGNFRQIPSESELFYGIIQDTNDLWNATFFCGSCAVLRRESIKEVGGIAHETVTEDAHTSLRMQKLRWNTAYINLPQAAGLATETLGDHVKQRVRWARGMTQILRVDNPLFARGLTFSQRLCYLNAMLHFLYALPRLIFLTAPILYLVFGKLNIPGYWLAILVFALPHLVIANLVNSRIQGLKRYSFWNEIYETVLSPYILLPTLFALISPKFGKFNVTAKGQNQQEDSFDSKLARPFLFLLALNVLALAMAVPRYLYWDRNHAGTVVMNLVWTLFNIVVLSVSLSVCWEKRQRRQSVRVNTSLPVEVRFGEVIVAGLVRNLSVTGAAITASLSSWKPGDKVKIAFPLEDADHSFAARVVHIDRGETRFAFEITSVEEQEAVTRVMYLTADRWLDWNDGRAPNSMLGSFGAVFVASIFGARKMLRLVQPTAGQPTRAPAVARSAVVVLLTIGLLLVALYKGHAEPLHSAAGVTPSTNVHVAFHALGAHNGILLNGGNRNQAVEIALPDNVLVEEGALHLKYTLPQATEPASTLEVLLNGLLLASITPTPAEIGIGHGEATIPLPAEQIVRQNRITLQLANAGGSACAVTKSATAPIRIDPDSEISLKQQRLVLASELSLLPQPFSQRSSTQFSEIPVVFGHTPGHQTLQAAGVLASWFGSQAVQGQVRFEVKTGSLPQGNAVLFLLDGEQVGGVGASTPGRPEIRTMANPVDIYGKLLVFSASREDDLLRLVQALAIGQLNLFGERANLGELNLPAPRLPDDAPRWIHSQRVSLEQLAGTDHLSVIGDNPLNLYLRLAPDLDFGVRREMYLHLNYASDAGQLDPKSNIIVRLNGSPAPNVPLRFDGDTSRSHQTDIPLGDLPASNFGNTLQVQFYFVPSAARQCEPNRFSATLGGGSFLDLGAASHLAKLPNLHLFSNAGFPFTRQADLSQTTILLPHEPSAEVVSEYLDLLAYFGTATGYPALRVTLDDIPSAQNHGSNDLMVLGTYHDLAGIPPIADQLPLRLTEEGWALSFRARLSRSIKSLLRFAQAGGTDSLFEDGEIAPAGVIESVQSPFESGHSAVLIMAKDTDAVGAMRDSLLAELPHDSISGTASLWKGGKFVSYDLSTPGYRVGQVSVFERVTLTLPQYPGTLVAVLLVLSIILAIWMQAALAARIGRRLMGATQLDDQGNPGGAR